MLDLRHWRCPLPALLPYSDYQYAYDDVFHVTRISKHLVPHQTISSYSFLSLFWPYVCLTVRCYRKNSLMICQPQEWRVKLAYICPHLSTLSYFFFFSYLLPDAHQRVSSFPHSTISWENSLFSVSFCGCGYPDPRYLDRVKKQLADKGITSLNFCLVQRNVTCFQYNQTWFEIWL